MVLTACNSQEIQSAWRDRTITIDGNGNEWNNALSCYVDESRVLLGATNDFCNLYIRLSTSDRGLQRQLLHEGCTIWFDANGGKNKAFGLRHPMGRQMMPPQQIGEREPRVVNEQMDGMLEKAQEQVEILQPGSAVASRIMSLDEADKLGIELRMSVTKGLLVYEVKVPLICEDSSYPFVVAPHGVKTIGVGFAAGEASKGNRPTGRGPGGFGSGGGGPGGDFPGGGGGMPPPGGKRPEPFELWTKVSLALNGG